MNIQDIMKAERFYFQKKENYSIDDVFAIEEQLRNKLANALAKEFEAYDKTKAQEIETLKAKVSKVDEVNASAEAIKAEIAKEKEGFAAQIESIKKEYEAKIKQAEDALAPYKRQDKEKSANELLKGLVLAGAELDAYELLGNKLSEVQFEDGEDIASRQAKIKPLVEEIFATKAYLKPTVAAPAKKDTTIITKQHSAGQDDKVSPDNDMSSDFITYKGMVV